MANERVPEWLLERYAAGDLSREERDDVERRLAEEPDGEARLEALRQSDVEIRIQYPKRDVLPRIKQRAGVAERTRRTWLFAAPVMLAVAAALMLVVAQPVFNPGVTDPDIRLKGAQPSLQVYRKADGGAERLTDGSTAAAGDTLQLAYRSGGARFGVIVSIDGAGNATLHHPARPGGNSALDQGGEARLSSAYKLDDAPKFERFFLVTGPSPVPVRDVMAAARTLAASPAASSAPLPLDGDWVQVSVQVLK